MEKKDRWLEYVTKNKEKEKRIKQGDSTFLRFLAATLFIFSIGPRISKDL